MLLLLLFVKRVSGWGLGSLDYDGPLLPKISMLNSKDKLIPNMRGIVDRDIISYHSSDYTLQAPVFAISLLALMILFSLITLYLQIGKQLNLQTLSSAPFLKSSIWAVFHQLSCSALFAFQSLMTLSNYESFRRVIFRAAVINCSLNKNWECLSHLFYLNRYRSSQAVR